MYIYVNVTKSWNVAEEKIIDTFWQKNRNFDELRTPVYKNVMTKKNSTTHLRENRLETGWIFYRFEIRTVLVMTLIILVDMTRERARV